MDMERQWRLRTSIVWRRDYPLYDITRRRAVDGRAVLMEQITVVPALAPGLLEHLLRRRVRRRHFSWKKIGFE